MAETRGSIAYFTTYRPPVPLDIFSTATSSPSKQDEVPMTDGVSYNYNGQVIPPKALKTILKRPKLASQGFKEADVDSGRLSGMVFISERDNLETLHIALRFGDKQVKVFNFSHVFGTFNGVRMEDSGCIAGDYLVYITTKDPAAARRQPWTAVYKTNLKTATTERLTPSGEADLSPSVSPSGKKIAVASFEGKGGWAGEIEDLMTDIFVMNVDSPLDRKLIVKNGGWPTWGSDNVIFFHRKVGKFWGVFRADISDVDEPDISRVTPDHIDAITPAAISSTKVAVVTIRQNSKFRNARVDSILYRHIEIFDSPGGEPLKITQETRPKADHFNPFVIDGGERIGYHRCRTDFVLSEVNTQKQFDKVDPISSTKVPVVTIRQDSKFRNARANSILYQHLQIFDAPRGLPLKFTQETRPKTLIEGNIQKQFDKVESPQHDVGLFRVSGVFPSFSKDGSKLAFVDNEFKAVMVADSTGLHTVYERDDGNKIFSPVWNQDPHKDILYVCIGPSFKADQIVNICAIPEVSKCAGHRLQLTRDSNDACPSTNPDGTKLVFRSTRHGPKNLYIMEDAQKGEFHGGKITRLTEGEWTDTHCQWSPRGDWIVFSSTRDKPKKGVPDLDNGLDPGFFAVYLVKWNDPTVLVRVMGSGNDLAGHVNHPFFSPDGKSIVVTSDLAAVSADPISLPLFVHSVRPYGDIFTVDIDPGDIKKNENVTNFHRITHSRYENSTAVWTMFSTQDPNATWNLQLPQNERYTPSCPYIYPGGGESGHMTGHLCIPRRCC